jgi:hypothetical protein
MTSPVLPVPNTEVWGMFEAVFEGGEDWSNPLYEVSDFSVVFRSETGRTHKVAGFWDGGRTWRVRFQPDELGSWSYITACSPDSALDGKSGSFQVVPNTSELAIYRHGRIVRPRGSYHLTHADGRPFFWTADTAWNGALKSTQEEWRRYLLDRKSKGFNTIQFVTTQWRGGGADRNGRLAFTGSGRISLNIEFFQRLDSKFDLINEFGLVAAPVLLWTLQFGQGKELSPGYYLPDNEAILLARYLVARYGGHHVVWLLGGDGRYVDEYEQRWKNIGRGVFGSQHPGLVAQHPHGRSWIGRAYRDEAWLDIVGYQSSHSKREATVNWINRGPVVSDWDQLPPRPTINLEPLYEQIHEDVAAVDVRRACYWSVFAAPPSGISYGANGIWPWLRPGEKILNHRDAPWTDAWDKSLELPGSAQVGYLSSLMQSLAWWDLRPKDLLVSQPGDARFDHHVSVVGCDRLETVLVYFPAPLSVELRNPLRIRYRVRWFDPAKGDSSAGGETEASGLLRLKSPGTSDYVALLEGNSD